MISPDSAMPRSFRQIPEAPREVAADIIGENITALFAMHPEAADAGIMAGSEVAQKEPYPQAQRSIAKIIAERDAVVNDHYRTRLSPQEQVAYDLAKAYAVAVNQMAELRDVEGALI
jgi:hypothetical protein